MQVGELDVVIAISTATSSRQYTQYLQQLRQKANNGMSQPIVCSTHQSLVLQESVQGYTNCTCFIRMGMLGYLTQVAALKSKTAPSTNMRTTHVLSNASRPGR